MFILSNKLFRRFNRPTRKNLSINTAFNSRRSDKFLVFDNRTYVCLEITAKLNTQFILGFSIFTSLCHMKENLKKSYDKLLVLGHLTLVATEGSDSVRVVTQTLNLAQL